MRVQNLKALAYAQRPPPKSGTRPARRCSTRPSGRREDPHWRREGGCAGTLRCPSASLRPAAGAPSRERCVRALRARPQARTRSGHCPPIPLWQRRPTLISIGPGLGGHPLREKREKRPRDLRLGFEQALELAPPRARSAAPGPEPRSKRFASPFPGPPLRRCKSPFHIPSAPPRRRRGAAGSRLPPRGSHIPHVPDRPGTRSRCPSSTRRSDAILASVASCESGSEAKSSVPLMNSILSARRTRREREEVREQPEGPLHPGWQLAIERVTAVDIGATPIVGNDQPAGLWLLARISAGQ